MKLKVLHLLASSSYSGAENVVCTIIDAFDGEIDMCYCSLDGPISKVLDEKKVKYYALKKFNRSNLKSVIDDYKPDIIHAHDYRASLLAAFSGFKGKIISHLHINASFAKTWNFKTILYSLSIKKIDSVIGVSDSVYNEAIFKKKISNKYTTIYNYVNKELVFKKSNEYNYEKKYDLFFIGRLNHMKNPLQFIEIVNEIKKNKKDISAIMIGNGVLMENCQKLIRELDLTNNIELAGFIGNPFPIIKNCKICIMPSIVEGFGLTAIESLILNKPVFNSGVGGLGEIFKENQELICKNKSEYIEKIELELKNNNFLLINTEKYTNKENWKNLLKKIYMK